MFLRESPSSARFRILGSFLVFSTAFSGGAGILACVLHHPGRVEAAASSFAAPVIFFMPFVAFFYVGGREGLNRIAGWLRNARLRKRRPLKWIIDWPELSGGKPHTPAATAEL